MDEKGISEKLMEQLKDILVDPRDALLERQLRYLRKIDKVQEKYGEDKKNGDS